jgi:tetrahydromethanopterin S-methyltransferase subunit C
MWQARWAYFFALTLVIGLPALLQPITSRVIVWAAFIISIFPILHAWDQQLWPNESEQTRRIEARREAIQLRELCTNLRSAEVRAFLAPWWLSPSITYWSRQPGIAGSSHESLPGIIESARFFLTPDEASAHSIIQTRQASWVIAYDADRTAQVSARILGTGVPEHALCYILDRAPGHAPSFLVRSAQNATAKLFRVAPTAHKH